jgi:tRNA (guanine6-N2)-methyltransferase
MATTITGFEDVSAKEVKELLGVKVRCDYGRIFFESGLDAIYRVNLLGRCIHKLFLVLEKTKFQSLNDIYKQTKNIDFRWIINPNQTFAVRAERYGEHPFTSMDVASKVGQAIIDSYKDSTGKRLKVNLKNPDVELYAFVRFDEFILALNTTGESLHRRGYRVYQHPAALKTSLACCMLRYGGWFSSQPLLDPMCGGGTIPIEAALIVKQKTLDSFGREFAFKKLKLFDENLYTKTRESLTLKDVKVKPKIFGVEVSPKHLEGAKLNASSAGVAEDVVFVLGDATKLSKYLKDFKPEFVAVNLPYGIRSSRKKVLERLYKEFLASLRDVTDRAILVALTSAKEYFKKALEVVGFGEIGEKEVMHGNLKVTVFKCVVE